MKSLLTDKRLLKNGGRIGAAISKQELKNKILTKGKKLGADSSEDWRKLYDAVQEIIYKDPVIKKDLSKINFDTENLDVDGMDIDYTGFYTLENGFTFLLCVGGGDWEQSLGFIIYYDGEKLRAYIPTLGNTFNLKKKCAYGSEDDGLDGFDHLRNFIIEVKGSITQQEEQEIEYGDYNVDLDLFKEDIMHRIVVK